MESITEVDEDSRDRITALMLLSKNIEAIRVLDDEDSRLLVASAPDVSQFLH